MTVWSQTPANLTLVDDEVHVWRASLDVPSFKLQQFQKCLAENELSRANRFVFEKDRNHYVAARGQLRHILSFYLPQKPETFQFEYTSHGKPSLVGDHGLNFNLSHSGKLVLYAITRRRELGIDIELMRPDFSGIDIAEHYFSKNEVAVFQRLPENLRPDAFFTCWTRKEAYIKAIGEGLSCPLYTFDVAFAPSEAPMLLANRTKPDEISRWSMHDFAAGDGYKAALCVEGFNLRVSCWQFPA
jgi:4'-phosphopantetheinyl transferase